jgi:hypothetical protein
MESTALGGETPSGINVINKLEGETFSLATIIKLKVKANIIV